MEDKQISFRSAEVREIVTQVPHWIIRWGITVFFLVLALIFVCSWIVRYPDIIKVPFRLTSINSPKSVLTKVNGKIIKLFVKENDILTKGQILGYIESTGSHQQIIALDSQLNVIGHQAKRPDAYLNLKFEPFDNLGEVQPEFQKFNQDFLTYLSFQTNGYHNLKRQILENELNDLKELSKNLEERKQLCVQDLELAAKEFDIHKKLAEQDVISFLDLKREESKFLSKKIPLKEIQSAILTNRSEQNGKLKEILEINKSINEQLGIFLQSLNTLKSSIDAWKNKYILIAPIEGKVFFTSIIEENHYIEANQEIFYISPKSQNYYGELYIPQYKMGKVQLGQKVLIKFNSYPFTEYGIIKGKISFISEIPGKENSFLAKVEFTDQGNTKPSSNKKIIFKSGMTATAEIITQDMSVLEKIFHTLKRSLNNV